MKVPTKIAAGGALFSFVDLMFRRVFAELYPNTEYVPADYVDLICDHLQRIEQGEFRRLLLAVPPRYLKSTIVTVTFTAWMMGRHPELKVLLASYGQDLASKLARDIRTIVSTPWYRKAFPQFQFGRGKNTEAEFQTTRNGYLKAVSVEGGVTGYGADLIVFDDPIKVADAGSAAVRQRAREYFDQSLFPRLNDKEKGIVLVLQQRLHREDLVGHLQETGTFKLLSLPAVATADENYEMSDGRTFKRRQGEALLPQRDSVESLLAIRRQIGAAAYEAQYQQDPTAIGGGYVDWSWFKPYEERLPRNQYHELVHSWDVAGGVGLTNDYSVGMAFGWTGEAWHLLEIMRGRWVYPDLVERVDLFKRIWRPNIVILERSGIGLPLFQTLQQRNYPVLGFLPTAGKVARFEGVTERIRDGELLIPREARWLPEFRRELMDFPNATHDDQIDALSQFMNLAARHEFLQKCIEGRRRAVEERVRRSQNEPYRRPSLREHILNSYNQDAPSLAPGGI